MGHSFFVAWTESCVGKMLIQLIMQESGHANRNHTFTSSSEKRLDRELWHSVSFLGWLPKSVVNQKTSAGFRVNPSKKKTSFAPSCHRRCVNRVAAREEKKRGQREEPYLMDARTEHRNEKAVVDILKKMMADGRMSDLETSEACRSSRAERSLAPE